MEEGLTIDSRAFEELGAGKTEVPLNQYSPLVLAYIGDAVYELFVRNHLVSRKNCPVQKLHKEAIRYVRAAAQAEIVTYWLEEGILTEEEESVFRRGKNAHAHTIPKNANPAEYRKATAFEAVIGYLYLKGDMNRATKLMRGGVECLTPQEERK